MQRKIPDLRCQNYLCDDVGRHSREHGANATVISAELLHKRADAEEVDQVDQCIDGDDVPYLGKIKDDIREKKENRTESSLWASAQEHYCRGFEVDYSK